MIKQMNTDVLVIGGGGAAARAAIEAGSGATVIMAFKGRYGHSGATGYKVSEMGGFNAGDGAADPTDCSQEHYHDIMAAADGLSIPSLSQIVADSAVDTLRTLDRWGVPFERDGEEYLAFQSCFSSKARTHVIKGHGEPILDALGRRLKRKEITMLEDTMAARLIIEKGRCRGALLLDKNGEPTIVTARAVILATGGAGQVFARNLNPPDITGDGYALGFEAGARLINMEFMQAGIGLSHPITSLLNAYIWAGMPKVTDREGREFLRDGLPKGVTLEQVMADHSRHFPFSTSDRSYLLEALIQKHLLAGGGTPEGGVYMDLTHFTDEYVQSLPEESGIRKMWHIARDFFLSRGVDVLREPVQIACFAHAINGGLLIDEGARTTVPGLYAAGETAGGPHGADRLGGNMLVTCQIFGALAAQSALDDMKSMPAEPGPLDTQLTQAMWKDVHARLHRDIDCEAIQSKLQAAAQRQLLVRRTEEGLTELLHLVAGLEDDLLKSAAGVRPNIRNLETENLLQAAKLMATAALLRRESRGAHYREDFPQRDERLSNPILLQNNAGMVQSGTI